MQIVSFIRYILYLSLLACSFVGYPYPVMAQDIPAVIRTVAGYPLITGAIATSPVAVISIKYDISRSIQYKWQNPDSAMYLLQRALDRSLEVGYYDGATTAETNMGLVAMGHGDFNGCFLHYQQAYNYALKSINEQELLSTLFINVGATYFYQENYEKSFKYYYAILQYMLKVNPKDRNVIMAYNNIADVLLHMEQYDKAGYYLEKGEKLMLELQMDQLYCYIWANKSEIYLIRGDFKTADQYTEMALANAQKHNNQEAEQAIYVGKGKLYLKKNDPAQAIIFFNKALKINTLTYPFYSLISPLYYLGFAYYQTGEYKKAEEALTKALDKAKYTGILAEKLKALSTLSSIYEKDGRLKAALLLQHEFNNLRDSTLNKEKIEATNQLEIKYRTAQKDKELIQKELVIEKKDRDLEHKNNLITAAILGLGLLGISAIALYRNFKNRNKISTLKARIEGEEIERSRIAMELHDGVGGMLAAIKMRLYANRTPDESENEVLKLLNTTSDEVRKTAHNLMPVAVQNFGLKEALTQFCQTIRRSSDLLEIDLRCTSELNIHDGSVKLSIYRIVQESIQNIIKHAHATLAIIQIFEKRGILHLLIEDNGVGFDATRNYHGQGFANLEARVKSLQGTISIESASGIGTTINIELNLANLK